MKKIIFISAVLAVICSCAKEETNTNAVSDGLRSVTISVDAADDISVDETKAWYDFKEGLYKFKWLSGGNDKIGVFDSNADIDGGHEFSTVEGGINNNRATITGTICTSATGPVVFLYPKQSKTYTAGSLQHKTNISGNKITSVFIPYETTVKANAMDANSATRIGVISDAGTIGEEGTKLSMYNPLAAVRFTLKNCTDAHPLKSIEIFGNNGEKIAGYCDIDFSNPKNPIPVFKDNPVLSGQGQCVAFDLTLTPKESTYYVDTTYIAALAPNTFSKGITLKFVDSKGYVAFLGSNKALTINRNHIKNLGEIDVQGLDWHFALNMHFMNIAFVNSVISNGRPAIPYSPNSENSGNGVYEKTAPFYTGSSQTIPFKIGIESNGKYGRWANGFEYSGLGSYVEFPPVEGKILTKIWIRSFGNGNTSGNLCIVRASDGKYLKKDGTWAAVPAGSSIAADSDAAIWAGKKTVGLHHSWDNCFATGQSYRIQITSSDATCIKDIILFYDDATKATALTGAPQVNDWNPGAETDGLMY